MKTKIVFILLLPLIILLMACSESPSDVLGNVKKYYLNGDYDGVISSYTNGTAAAVEDFKKHATNMKINCLNLNKKFAEDSSWDIVDEKMEGDTALVIIKYTEHPVENMKGLEIAFRMKKEGGKWKIDEENEIRESIEFMNQKAGKGNARYRPGN